MRSERYQRDEPVGMTGAPQELTEYVGWFNQRFRFAKAEVRVGTDGKRFMDLKWK